MLTHLHIENFTLVDELDIELHQGLTTITGETGAGKSILLGALGLTLGERTDASKVRAGSDRADIHASFDIAKLKFAKRWLEENELDVNGDECILRRVITQEGRSRAYINGKTVTLAQLKSFAERLVDIHSQHEHQSLLDSATHRRLLDAHASAESLVDELKSAHHKWQTTSDRLTQAREQGDELNARFQLLRYQVEELDQLALEPGEVDRLEEEQTLLANAELTKENSQHINEILGSEGVGVKDRLNQALRLINDLPAVPKGLNELHNLLSSAVISVDEAQSDLDRFLDNNEIEDNRLHEVEQRLNQVYDIARKHRVHPEEVVELHEKLAEELASISSGDDLLASLDADLKHFRSEYDRLAVQLSDKREKAAKKLASSVNKKLKTLAMEHASFEVSLQKLENLPSRYGNERVEFLISTVPNQPAQALQKIASGGELSRVSLAIQVISAQTSTIPTLVFDEVDVGIGGTTGDTVGEMLRELGEKGQIFCVTHLAQVASKAHHHLRIEKHISKKDARSSLTTLQHDEKILEIARMMGGEVESKQSLDHARQMLGCE